MSVFTWKERQDSCVFPRQRIGHYIFLRISQNDQRINPVFNFVDGVSWVFDK